MKISIDWNVILRKLRIIFLIGVFYAIYTYAAPVWAFMWLAWFILNDLSDIEIDVAEIKEGEERWSHIFSQKRSNF